jgi:cellulose synthase/poly-beta-1,6-N-acetylglucosamine synthase-like glycosyltransferase
MNLSIWTRQSHRWLSIVFTLTVVANFVFRAVASDEPPLWLTYSPLPPLFLQLFTGLYLFALPYTAKWRSRVRA